MTDMMCLKCPHRYVGKNWYCWSGNKRSVPRCHNGNPDKDRILYRSADNEIIKALECCVRVRSLSDCLKSGCPARKRDGCSYYLRTDDDFEGVIFVELIKDALDLINRQMQEIDRLSDRNHKCVYLSDDETTEFCVDGPCPEFKTVGQIKSEAYREFAEKTNKMITQIYNKHIFGNNDLNDEEKDAIINFSDDVVSGFANLVKEMVGDA